MKVPNSFLKVLIEISTYLIKIQSTRELFESIQSDSNLPTSNILHPVTTSGLLSRRYFLEGEEMFTLEGNQARSSLSTLEPATLHECHFEFRSLSRRGTLHIRGHEYNREKCIFSFPVCLCNVSN